MTVSRRRFAKTLACSAAASAIDIARLSDADRTLHDSVLAKLEPDASLYEQVLANGLRAVRIGDCKQVRNLRTAVTEGANAGLTLDADLMLNANAALIARLPTEAAGIARS